MNGITPRISLMDVQALRPASFGAQTDKGSAARSLSPLEALLQPEMTPADRPLPEKIPAGSFYGMVGKSPTMLSIFATLARMAAYPVTPLLLGEPGSGKSCAARAIHRASDRAKTRMISFDCRRDQDVPMENILFGQIGGIGPSQRSPDRPGLLELAHEGTLYLQEIDALPIDVQVKLLRLLESREIRRVGSAQRRRLDVRIITSSRKDLSDLCTQGKFRGDLLYRLNVGSIGLPALREVPEEIPVLITHLLEQIATTNGLRQQALSPEAQQWLAGCLWPENVRELFKVLLEGSRQACGREIQQRDLLRTPPGHASAQSL
jgi:two-component system response regulator HydG